MAPWLILLAAAGNVISTGALVALVLLGGRPG